MRKSVKYFLLFIGSIILLAHNVIPHHHHQTVICVEQSHCHTYESHTDGSHDAEGHSHDSDQQSTDCVLKQDIIRPSNNWKMITEISETHYIQFLDLFTAQHLNQIQETALLNRKILFRDQTPVLSTIFLPSTGLRAPPLV